MSDARTKKAGDDSLHSVSTWVRRYAAHRRGLAVVVGLVIILAIFAAIGGGSYLGGQAYRAENMPLAWIGILTATMGCLVTFFMAFTRSGHELPLAIALRISGDPGEANLDCGFTRRKRQMGVLMGIALAACILTSVYLGDAIPIRYRQPVSALYVVPFLVGVWLLQRPAGGYLTLMWPALYALHAVLLIMGAPILFTGRWEAMNLLLPIVGFGILVNLANHLYARFAFHKVRKLARMDDPSKS